MLKISLDSSAPMKILCLGAHCDDIEIGCGGTILKMVRARKDASVRWVVFSSDERREKEALNSAKDFLSGLKKKKIDIHRFRNSFFPYCGADIKECFEDLKKEFSPDMIFTHYRNDLHQDHRLISELTWNTFRDHLILEYEIPKYDGDLGSPNLFVHLEESIGRKKSGKILEYFRSQNDKQWFTEDTFLSLLRIRGVESNAPGKYAEGFYCRKMIL
ncbi:MAG: PIG-L family deacetylase [Deltaproteobacteria bacterium]|nr:PIG-L family deacetylase [Deltaproteobacteria bacterium]PWB62056.1 MAG: PIG-L domain-containing protein [Deltaproteobacteria bacterium]